MSDNPSEEGNGDAINRLWSNLKRKGDGKCYCPCNNCKGLNIRRLLIKIAKRHCRDNGHIEGGFDYHELVDLPRGVRDMDHGGANIENMALEVEDHGGANIEAEDYDPMEDDNDAPDDGTNTLIHDTFGIGTTDDDDQDDVDVIHDIPLLEKAATPLYEGSQTTLLSVVLLLLNLKVMNGLSNTAMSRMLWYVIFVIIVIKW